MQDEASCTPDEACVSSQCDGEGWMFARVRVRPTITRGTWVEWLLHPDFVDPLPHSMQLQVGHTGSNLADDWQDVGSPAENASYLIDDEQRSFGETQWTHYRIKLTTPVGEYTSEPQHCWGDLPFRFWRLWANRIRQYRLQFERTQFGQQGYLLKRRLTGEQPELGKGILDYQTGEVINAQSAETVGTEFVKGYYDPIPCVYAELNRISRNDKLDGQTRGSTNVIANQATMLAIPQIDSYDVWVDKDTDHRWWIRTVQHKEEMGGVPIVYDVELRLLPFSHPLYLVDIPGQRPG